jgi:hypothetical protein
MAGMARVWVRGRVHKGGLAKCGGVFSAKLALTERHSPSPTYFGSAKYGAALSGSGTLKTLRTMETPV